MSATSMVGWRRKILKLHRLKRPKTVQKITKFGPGNKWLKTSYLVFEVYLLISDFLAKSFKGSKNWQKRLLILQYNFSQILLILQTSTHSTF